MRTGTVEAGPRTERRPRRRRSELTRSRLVGVSLIAAVTACVAVFASDASPTGWTAMDVAYRAAFAVATVVAASRARRWSLLIAAALVAVGTDGAMLVVGVIALGVAVVLAWRNKRNRIAGALVGGLVTTAALHLSWPASPDGATAVLAALAVVPLWISGIRVSPRTVRRRIYVGLSAWAVVMLVGTAAAAVFAQTQRPALLEAADATVENADGIASGDDAGAAAGFEEAGEQFAAVADAAEVWWMAPARAVPVVGQNVEAVHTTAQAGATLNRVAATLSSEVDYDALRGADGRIDLDRLRSLAPPVATAAATIAAVDDELAAQQSPWLVDPLTSQLDEFRGELAEVRSGTEMAATAVDGLPAMLGADGPRRYLLLLGNPAEARDLGGHLGNWAEITAIDGKIDTVRVGEPYDLFGPGTDPTPSLSQDLAIPPALAEMDPTVFPQNWGASPDLRTVTDLAADLYPQSAGGAPIDGVIYADPRALAALLSIVGPVTLADGTAITSENAVQFLTRDQFARADDDASVSELVDLALDRLTNATLPAPSELAEAFSPVVAAGQLQFVSTHPGDGDLLRLSGLDRPVVAPDGGDLVAVVNRNANPSKIDSYLERTVDYSVRWDPDSGAVTSRVTVTMTNTAPAEGLAPLVGLSAPGAAFASNRTQLSVITPFRAVGALVDRDDVAIGSQRESSGLRRHSVLVDIPSGATKTVSFDLAGEVDPGSTYRLRWVEQPLLDEPASRLLITSTGEPFRGGSNEGVVPLGPDRITDVSVSTT